MWITVMLLVVVAAIVALVFIPRSRNADDGPVPNDVQLQLLLGEDPDQAGSVPDDNEDADPSSPEHGTE